MKKGAGTSCSGEVTSVGAHHASRKHVRVTVAHGTRKPAPKQKGGKNAPPYASDYDDRPTTDHMVPKGHAHLYPVGQRVTMSLAPAAGADGDAGEDLDQMSARVKAGKKRPGGWG